MTLRLRKLIRPLYLALLLAGPAAAGAQGSYARFRLPDHALDRMLSPEYSRCMDASGAITIEMRDCASAEMGRLDLRLNTAYRAAMARLPGAAARLRLRGLERAWLRTRWNECHRLVAEEGGTMALLVLDSCQLEETARRIAWLERYGRR